jgi:hypothetical protein
MLEKEMIIVHSYWMTSRQEGTPNAGNPFF